jgi:ankyrin repeat protein
MVNSPSQFTLHPPLNLSSREGFTNKRIQPINYDKVHFLKQKLIPLILPFYDIEGRIIQLWKMDDKMIGAVLEREGQLVIVPEKKIINSLNSQEPPAKLIARLTSCSLRKWDIAYDVNTLSLSIWPHLEAAGRHNYILEGKVAQSQYDKKPCQEVIKDLNERLIRLTEKGALNRYHYTAYRKEAQGIVLLNREGKPLLNPKNGKPYDHIKDVSDQQNGAKKIIRDIRLRLRFDDLTAAERKELESILAKTSKILDESWKFTTKAATPARKQFYQTLQQTRLTSSYNSTHPHSTIPAKGGAEGEIGGVACSMEYIEGLFDSPNALFENTHFFCTPQLPEGEFPFSNEELQHILRELALGIYVDNTIPFFSLHFKQGTADLFPVIHPAYENTLVGRVISMLDYMMKGYLNGGIYSEEFVDEWYKNPDWNKKSSSALEKLISFEEYCKAYLKDGDKNYFAVNGLTHLIKSKRLWDKIHDALFVDEPYEKIFESQEGFKNSFRIIAKQNSYRKEENLFLIDTDFEVRYTIEPSPAYNEALAKHVRKYGCMPAAYTDLENAYELMSERIHNHMVKMPLCRHYFSMLGIINFFSSYFSTLKKYGKVPILPSCEQSLVHGCPPLFPYLPISIHHTEKLEVNKREIMRQFLKSHEGKLKGYFKSLSELMLLHREEENLEKKFFLDQKTALLDLLQEIVKKNAFQHANLSVQTYLNQNDLFQPTYKRVASLYFEQILSDYVEILKNLKINYYSLKLSEPKARALLYAKLFELIFDISKISNNSVTLNKLQYEQIHTSPQVSKEIKEKSKRVVGGCGMELATEQIQGSPLANTIVHDNWSKLHKLIPETWTKIKSENFQGAAFSLMHEDAPLEWIQDYSWMESYLLVPKGNDWKAVEQRQKLEKAIQADQKDEFMKLMATKPPLHKMIDRYKRTLLHIAALARNPFYLDTLLSQTLACELKDVHGYLPIHYAAMAGNVKHLELLLKKNANLISAASNNGSTALIVAIQHQQLEFIHHLLKRKTVLATLSGGYTELHCALHEGDLSIIHRLLESKSIVNSCINICSDEGGTPLMMACEHNLVEVVSILLEKGADPSIKRQDGVTAIEIAIRNNCLPILKLLFQATQPSSLAIEAAAQEGSSEVIEFVALNTPKFSQYKSCCGDTPLHIALRYGNLSAAQLLINFTEDLNSVNIENETPFSIAASLGAWSIVKELFKKHASIYPRPLLASTYNACIKKIFNSIDISSEELDKYTLVAAQAGNYEIISLIFKPMGANLEAIEGPNGWKLLHYLAKADGIFLFRSLIYKVKDSMQPLEKEYGKTLAYIAAENGSLRVLHFLIQIVKKNNISLENHYGKKHLFYAAMKSGQQACIELLLKSFTTIDLVNIPLDDRNCCASHLAARTGSQALVQLLIEKGANLSKIDDKNHSPLFYAIRSNSLELVTFLLKHKILISGEDLCEAARKDDERIFDLLMLTKPPQAVLDDALYEAILHHSKKAFFLLRKNFASFNYANPYGWTPTMLAAFRGDKEILEAILHTGFVDKRTTHSDYNALHLACSQGNPHSVQLLLNAGFLNEGHKSGKSNLELACKHPGVVAILNNKTAERDLRVSKFYQMLNNDDVNGLLEIFPQFDSKEIIFSPDNFSNYWGTYLHFILQFFKKDNVRLLISELLKYPVLIHKVSDSNGDTVAHLLAKNNLSLLSIPASELTVKNHKGSTPLHLAAQYCNLVELKTLIQQLKKKDLNRKDNEGRTPLFYAIRNNTPTAKENIRILAEFGANLEHYDFERITPLIFACKHNKSLAVNALLKYGARPNQIGTLEKVTPLSISLALEREEIARHLLLKGANPHIIDEKEINIITLPGAKRVLKLLMARQEACNNTSRSSLEPAHLAAYHGQTDILSNLKQLGVSLDTPVELETSENLNDLPNNDSLFQGATPLHLAIFNGQAETARWLLKQQVQVQSKTDHGLDVLSFAAMNKAAKPLLEIFYKYRISKNVESLNQAARIAISQDNIEAVIYLYQHGITPNTLLKPYHTGLHIACMQGALQSTAWLLHNGADPWANGPLNKNAFELAAENSSYTHFRLLIGFARPDLDETNHEGKTLMHLATAARNFNHIVILILNHANLDIQDDTGLTPLHSASQKGQVEIVRLLLTCGANQEICNVEGKRPIDLVAEDNDTLRRVFKKYQKLDRKKKKNETLLHRAVRSNYPLAIPLLSRTQYINEQDSEGSSALHLAVRKGQTESVRRLLHSQSHVDIDVDIFDKHYRTPLWYACVQKQHFDIARLLIKAGAHALYSDISALSIIQQVEKIDFEGKEKFLNLLNNEARKSLHNIGPLT